MLDWKKDGLQSAVLIKYDGYAANVNPMFEGRVELVNEISLKISNIQESDEGWYECKVIYLNGVNNNKEPNGTWIYLNVYSKYKNNCEGQNPLRSILCFKNSFKRVNNHTIDELLNEFSLTLTFVFYIKHTTHNYCILY